jgi:hypothetical protein
MSPTTSVFFANAKKKATFKVYHIPLDIHAFAVIRGSLINVRKAVGHLHHFAIETALATLTDRGDYSYTAPALDTAA